MYSRYLGKDDGALVNQFLAQNIFNNHGTHKFVKLCSIKSFSSKIAQKVWSAREGACVCVV